MHWSSWFDSIPFIKEICFPFLTSSLPYWYFLNLQINCWLFVSESASGWTPRKTSVMPRAEIGYEFRPSVSRVHALTNPSADTRRKARQRARKKAQRLEKIWWVWRNSSLWLEQDGLGSGMWVGEDGPGNEIQPGMNSWTTCWSSHGIWPLSQRWWEVITRFYSGWDIIRYPLVKVPSGVKKVRWGQWRDWW